MLHFSVFTAAVSSCLILVTLGSKAKVTAPTSQIRRQVQDT